MHLSRQPAQLCAFSLAILLNFIVFATGVAAQSGNGSGGGGGGGSGSTSQASGEKLMDVVSSLRTRKAIGNIPGLVPLTFDRSGSMGEYFLDDQSKRLRFKSAFKNVWGSLSYQEQTNKRSEKSDILGASFGGHVQRSKHQALGALFLIDGYEQEAFSGSADSKGWMIGAYVAGKRPKAKLSYDLAILAGQSTSRLSPLGTYSDKVTVDRVLVTGRLSQIHQKGKWRLVPLLRLKYAHERWPVYVDQASNMFNSREYEFAEVRAQVRAEYAIDPKPNAPKLYGTASITALEDVSPVPKSILYGGLEIGLTVPITKTFGFRLSWKKDRIWDAPQNNLQLRLNLRF